MAKRTGAAAERSLVDMSTEPEPEDSGWVYNGETIEEKDEFFVGGDQVKRILMVRREASTGLVDFAIHVQWFLQGTWHDVYRVDIAHGTLHEHLFFERPAVRREHHRIEGPERLEQDYGLALGWAYEHAEEYLERWWGRDASKR